MPIDPLFESRFVVHGRFVPIAPDAGLFLLRLGVADDDRLARLIGDAWATVPEEYREFLIDTVWDGPRAWMRQSGRLYLPGREVAVPPGPVVSAPRRATRDPDGGGRVPWAGDFGYAGAQWDGDAVDAIPDGDVRTAAAFSLAAAACWPKGLYLRDEDAGEWSYSRYEDGHRNGGSVESQAVRVEQDRRERAEALALIASWGYDAAKISRWLGGRPGAE